MARISVAILGAIRGRLIRSFLLLILFEGGKKMAYKLEDGGDVKDIWDMAILQW